MEDVLEMSVDSSVLATELNNVDPSIVTQTEIQLKYEGYISREEDVAKKMNRLEDVKIPEMIDYSKLTSLSAEAKEKLTALAPVTIGQASRISGISPSDVSVLLVYLGR
jgi:tRNA uridine 5-carboxymethylaminomethyl modification enzyme